MITHPELTDAIQTPMNNKIEGKMDKLLTVNCVQNVQEDLISAEQFINKIAKTFHEILGKDSRSDLEDSHACQNHSCSDHHPEGTKRVSHILYIRIIQIAERVTAEYFTGVNCTALRAMKNKPIVTDR